MSIWAVTNICKESGVVLVPTIHDHVTLPSLSASLEYCPAAILVALTDPKYIFHPYRSWYSDSDIVNLARLICKRRHIHLIRLMFFDVRPCFRKLGIDAILFSEVKEYVISKNY